MSTGKVTTTRTMTKQATKDSGKTAKPKNTSKKTSTTPKTKKEVVINPNSKNYKEGMKEGVYLGCLISLLLLIGTIVLGVFILAKFLGM